MEDNNQPNIPPIQSISDKLILASAPNQRLKFLPAILLLLFLIIGLVIFVFQTDRNQAVNQQLSNNNKTITPTEIEVSPTQKIPQPTFIQLTILDTLKSGWRVFTFPDEKLTINFPDDWKLSKRTDVTSVYTLTSPNRFQLTFAFGLDGLGGGCDEECPKHNLDNIVLDTLYFYTTPLYVVVNGLKDNSAYGKASIAFNVITEKTCWSNVCYGFEGKNIQGMVIISGGYVAKNDLDLIPNGDYIPTNEFVSSPDVKIALTILKSLSY